MKKISKISIALASLLMLNGCAQVGSVTSQVENETIGTSNIAETKLTEIIGTSEKTILDITNYIDSLSDEEMNSNLSMYLFDIYMYSFESNLIKETLTKSDAEYSQFCVKNMNKKYPLDLSTNYPIVDEYYKMLDYEAKQKIDTLHYVDEVPTFTYELHPNHDELERQFHDLMDSYYYDVTDEKVQALNYPFNKITVDNSIPSDLVDIEKECVQKYEYHYNGLRCLNFESRGYYLWGEDAPTDKDWAIKTCFEILCRMKNFTEEYSTVVGENPQDVDLVNEYIEKYSSAYMYVLQNRDTLTDEEIYTYLHNFLFDEEIMDLQTKIYKLEIPNLDEILVPID